MQARRTGGVLPLRFLPSHQVYSEADQGKDRSLPVIYLTASAVEEWTAEGVLKSILMPKPHA